MRHNYKAGEGEMTPEEFGRRLRAAIDHAVLRDRTSISALAERAGLRRATLHQYMNGKLHPGFTRIYNLILILDLDPQILMPELFYKENNLP